VTLIGRTLQCDLARILVAPQPDGARVAQLAVAGQFGEADLRHELRTHPVHRAPQELVRGEGCLLLL
jgi:hypothetical protein